MAHDPSAAAVLRRKLAALLRKPRFTLVWLVPVWLLLGAARAAVLVVPFRRIAPALGRVQGVAPYSVVVSAAAQERARQIARVIALAARYTPWTSNCFPQAIAARAMLGLCGLPHVIFFGLMRDADDADIKAHAWVTCGQVAVSGGDGHADYTAVGVFAND